MNTKPTKKQDITQIGDYTVYETTEARYNGERCYRVTAGGGSIEDFFGNEAMILHTEEHGDRWTVYVIPGQNFVQYAARMDAGGAWAVGDN